MFPPFPLETPLGDPVVWDAACEILVNMEGLVDLEVELLGLLGLDSDPEAGAKLLRSLKSVRCSKRFVVKVLKPAEKTLQALGSEALPFVILRECSQR